MVGTHAGGIVVSQSRRSRKWTLRHKSLKSCSCQAIAVLTTSIRRNTGSDSPRYVIARSPRDELSFRTSLNQAPRNGGNSASLVNHRRRTRRLLFLIFFLVSPNQQHSKAIIDHLTGNGK